jgi:hypothetical protein
MVQVGNVEFDQASSANSTNTGFLTFAGSAGHGTICLINEGTIILSGTSNLRVETFLNDTNAVFDLESDAGFTAAGGSGFINKGAA